MHAQGYTAEEILLEIILDSLRAIEHYTRGWYKYSEDNYMNAVCIGKIEMSLETLCIVKDGYNRVIKQLHLIERNDTPILQRWTKDGWQDIDMVTLCLLFDVNYFDMVRISK